MGHLYKYRYHRCGDSGRKKGRQYEVAGPQKGPQKGLHTGLSGLGAGEAAREPEGEGVLSLPLL